MGPSINMRLMIKGSFCNERRTEAGGVKRFSTPVCSGRIPPSAWQRGISAQNQRGASGGADFQRSNGGREPMCTVRWRSPKKPGAQPSMTMLSVTSRASDPLPVRMHLDALHCRTTVPRAVSRRDAWRT